MTGVIFLRIIHNKKEKKTEDYIQTFFKDTDLDHEQTWSNLQFLQRSRLWRSSKSDNRGRMSTMSRPERD